MAVARRVIWAPAARRDLVGIWKYLAGVASEQVADSLLRKIADAVDRLIDHPYAGRPRNEIGSGLRSVLVQPHLIVYRVANATIEIVRILHERQDISSAFDEPSP